MAGYALIASGAMLLFAQSQGLELSPAMKFAPWLMFCRQLMLGSAAMLLSLFVHPIVASVLAFFSGNGLFSSAGHGLFSRYNPLYAVLPDYSDFNLMGQVYSGTLVNAKDVAFLSLYAADIVIIMLLLAIWRFRAKELV